MMRSRSIRFGRQRSATFSTFLLPSIRRPRSSHSIATIGQPKLFIRRQWRDRARRQRFTKNLWTERASGTPPQLVSVRDEADQARYIVERVLENREGGSTLKQQAVLFRTSHHSGPLEIELTRRNIPFVKFGGLKFLDAAHIKDLLALLRFVENPRDRVAGFRLLQLMQGVGPASAQRVLDHMMTAADPIGSLVRCSFTAPCG